MQNSSVVERELKANVRRNAKRGQHKMTSQCMNSQAAHKNQESHQLTAALPPNSYKEHWKN